MNLQIVAANKYRIYQFKIYISTKNML